MTDVKNQSTLYFCDNCDNRCYLYELKNTLLYVCNGCSIENQAKCSSVDALNKNHHLVCDDCRVSFPRKSNIVYYKKHNKQRILNYSQYQFDNRLQQAPNTKCKFCDGDNVGMIKRPDTTYEFICRNTECGKYQ